MDLLKSPQKGGKGKKGSVTAPETDPIAASKGDKRGEEKRKGNCHPPRPAALARWPGGGKTKRAPSAGRPSDIPNVREKGKLGREQPGRAVLTFRIRKREKKK